MTNKSLSAYPREVGFAQLLGIAGNRMLFLAPLGLVAALMLAVGSPVGTAPSVEVQKEALAATPFVPPSTPEVVPQQPLGSIEVVPEQPSGSTAAGKRIDALAGFLARKYRVSQDAIRDLVTTAYAEGGRLGVDPLLIIAVMAVESSFNPFAESVAGAKGLMQVIPRYHSDKFDGSEAGKSVLDPDINIQIGARILKDYIRRGGSLVAGLQMYNGSPGDESNAYANRVLSEQQRLQQVVRRVHGAA